MEMSMAYDAFELTIEDRVAHLRLSRPGIYNRLDRTFWSEFPAAVRGIDDRAAARAIVFSADGRHFSAGMDLAILEGLDKKLSAGEAGRRAENVRRWILALQAACSVLEEIRIPVLAAVQGGCIGAGLDMVCACDMRFCTRDAFFVIQETRLGITADLGTLQRLPHLIPQGLAHELAYTGRRLHADEALSAGLVNRVFDTPGQMLEEVLEVARRIAQQSPLAVTGCKEMLNYARDHSVADSLNHMATWQGGMLRATDLREAFAAKREKRPPTFGDLWPATPPMDP